MSTESNALPATPSPRVNPSEAAVREELVRILGHPEFHATDKMRDFLRFVVEETLAGRKHRIKGFTIATQVFGRGDDFDPGQDPIVSIQAGRLRRALERYYLVVGGRDPVYIDVPKGGYVPRFTVQRPDSPDRTTGRLSSQGEPERPGGPTIAVLPFENLTGDPEQQILATGLTEELVTEMNRFQDVVVVPCWLASDGRELQADPLEATRTAGARFALQGAVRTDSATVKVSTRLTDTMNGRLIWAEGFTHPFEASRLIATQENIALSVVTAIGSEYGIIARRLSSESRKKAPAELDTYEAMLRYYTHQIHPSPESSRTCFVALQRAVEREPEYGPAWSALATLHCQMYTFDTPGFDDPLGTALRFARRGVFLEPGSQLARLILAYASYLAEDPVTFHQEIETALTLNPNSPYTVGTAGYFHVMQGDFERGLPLLDRAIAVNPCHPEWFHAGYVIHDLCRHDFERALQELQQHRPFLTFWLDVAYAAVLALLDRLDEARSHLAKVEEQKPDFAARARELLRRTVKIDALVEQILEALSLAGLPDTQSKAQ